MKSQFIIALVLIVFVWPVVVNGAYAQEGSGFVVINGKVYLNQKSSLSSIDIENGAVLWNIPVPAPGNSFDVGMIEENGVLVFCGSGSSREVFALDAKTGKLLWDEDGFCRAITSDAGKIFILHRPDGSISCLDVRTGKRLWKNEGNGPAGKILILKNRVISDEVQLDENTGKTIRKYPPHGDLLGASDENLFWGGASGALLCSTLNGRELWRVTMPLPRVVQFQSSADGEYVAAYDDYPYVGKSGVLLKLDKAGRELWRTVLKTGIPLPSSPFEQSSEKVYVSLPVDSQHSIIRELSKATGLEEWSSQPLDGVVGPVVEAQGKLLLGEREGQIRVLSKTTGTTVPF